jgi:hypothetical protein
MLLVLMGVFITSVVTAEERLSQWEAKKKCISYLGQQNVSVTVKRKVFEFKMKKSKKTCTVIRNDGSVIIK